MPSNRLILYHPLFFLPSISPNVRVFSNKLSLCHQVVEVLELQLPHQSFQWIFRMDFLYNTGLISLLSKELSRVFSSTTIQNHQFFSTQPSLWSNSHIHTWVLEKKKNSFDYMDFSHQLLEFTQTRVHRVSDAIQPSVVPFSYLQSVPGSGSFQISQFFPPGGQSIGISASASVLPMKTQDWFPLGWTGWISL